MGKLVNVSWTALDDKSYNYYLFNLFTMCKSDVPNL